MEGLEWSIYLLVQRLALAKARFRRNPYARDGRLLDEGRGEGIEAARTQGMPGRLLVYARPALAMVYTRPALARG